MRNFAILLLTVLSLSSCYREDTSKDCNVNEFVVKYVELYDNNVRYKLKQINSGNEHIIVQMNEDYQVGDTLQLVLKSKAVR